MNCSICGGNMENGGVVTMRSETLMWFSDGSAEKYNKFPQSLLPKSDASVDGISYKVSSLNGYKACRCENCGAILIIPPEDETE